MLYQNLIPGPTINSFEFLGDFFSFQGKYRHPSVRTAIQKLYFMVHIILKSWRFPTHPILPHATPSSQVFMEGLILAQQSNCTDS